MQNKIQGDDFNRLVNILSARPGFMNPLTRFSYVTSMMQVSPKAAILLSRLQMSMVNTRSDAVSLAQHLLQFGQDVSGREAITLLVRALLEDMGEGEDRVFLEALFEKYPLEQTTGDNAIVILFMMANPTDATRLRLDVEQREIDEVLLKSRYRDRFRLESQPALRPADLQEAMLRHQPAIAHFSGHGSDTHGLIFEDDQGKLQPISPDAVSELFGLLNAKVQIVVLNACYSAAQAEKIVPHVKCVVGMTEAVADQTAIQFGAAFYRALAYGLSVQTAYDLGCNHIKLMGLKGATTPILYHNPSVDPSQVKLV